MAKDIPLGKLAGFRVGMSWLVPLIALLYTVSLAGSRFPYEVPGQSDAAYWAAGVAGALLFFVSLVAHEVGHAVMARREGVGVEGITLNVFGGYTRMEHEARTAGAELRIAGIGPTVTAAAGVLFALLSVAMRAGEGGLVDLAGNLFGWLAFINILLAGVNLLPGSPLDGGRVLGALLWMRLGDRTTAQVWAARVGQGLGGVGVAVGTLLLVADGNEYGIWVLFLGGFVLANASSELRATGAMGMLRSVRVGEVMDPDPPVVPDWMPVQEVVALAARHLPHTAFPVQGADGRVTGLLTAEAVTACDPTSWPWIKVGQLAFPLERIPTAAIDDPVLLTMQRADAGPSKRVLVIHPDGRVAGVAGPGAVTRAQTIHRLNLRDVPPPPTMGGGAPPGRVGAMAPGPLPGTMPTAPPEQWHGGGSWPPGRY